MRYGADAGQVQPGGKVQSVHSRENRPPRISILEATKKSEDTSFLGRMRHWLRRLGRRYLDGRSRHEAPPLYIAPSQEEIDLGHPSVIGDWRVLGVVGEGTSSTVFRVIPNGTTHATAHYALKLHEGRQAGKLEARDRFKREMRILRSVKHPNIVQLLETGEYNGRLFIVMEMVEGCNLRQALEKFQPPLKIKLEWSMQIAQALASLHKCGIVHRDLKPENILATRRNTIKLVDFGLARTAEMAQITNVGFLVGTPAYIAPEYLLGDEPDFRSDLYSLGVILYELCTGFMPYQATTLGDFIDAHIEATPIPPRTRVPFLPRELELIILRLLEKRPVRRFQNAEAVRYALEEVLHKVVSPPRQESWHVA